MEDIVIEKNTEENIEERKKVIGEFIEQLTEEIIEDKKKLSQKKQ